MWSRPGTFLYRAVQLWKCIQLLGLILKSDCGVLKVQRAVRLSFFITQLVLVGAFQKHCLCQCYFSTTETLLQFLFIFLLVLYIYFAFSFFNVKVIFSSFCFQQVAQGCHHSSGWQLYQFKNIRSKTIFPSGRTELEFVSKIRCLKVIQY